MFTFIGAFITNTIFSLIVPGIVAGLVSIVVAVFLPPVLIKYKIILQLFGIGLIIFFVFHSGRFSENTKWKMKELEYQVEIADLKIKAANINTEIVIKYVDKIKIVEKIKEVPVTIYVDRVADASCVITDTTAANIRNLLNNAAIGKLPVTGK